MRNYLLYRLTVVIGIFISSWCNAFVPFNPIIRNDGSPYYWQRGIIGWLDVPEHTSRVAEKDTKIEFDRVLVLQEKKGDTLRYRYIHPSDPAVNLPKGLFCWQSNWKTFAKTLSSKIFRTYRGLIDDEYFFEYLYKNKDDYTTWVPVRRTPHSLGQSYNQQSKKWGRPGKNNWEYWKEQPSFEDPSKDVALFYRWSQRDTDANRLFRPLFFYELMGVTERYMREYFGADGNEFGKIPAKRNVNKTPMPHFTELVKYFPPDLTSDFPGRAFIQSNKGLKTYTIENLHRALPPIKEPGKGAFLVNDGYVIYNELGEDKNAQIQAMHRTDIRSLQADPANNDAVFQIASNFDSLEGGMGSPAVLITEMQYTPTQGEEASIATAARTLIRKYYRPPINLLKQVNNFLKVKEGVIVEVKQDLSFDQLPLIEVLWEEDVLVNSGYYPPTFIGSSDFPPNYKDIKEDVIQRVEYLHRENIVNKKRDPINIFNTLDIPRSGHSINQVFAAAANLNGKVPISTTTAQVILQASYLGALYATVVHGKRRLFLTLMGAGAFGNDLTWIADILNNDSVAQFISDYSIEVIINIFPDLRPHRRLDKDKETQGKYNYLIKSMRELHYRVNRFNEKRRALSLQSSLMPVLVKERLYDQLLLINLLESKFTS